MEFSDGVVSVKGALCFLVWKKGIIVVESLVNVWQFAFFEADAAFLNSIFLIAYLS